MMNAHRWTVGRFAVVAAFMSVLSFSVGSASASLGEFSASGSFSSTVGTEGIAVDESAGDVYAYSYLEDGGSISKFDADGNPANFSALGSSEIAHVGMASVAELAVDNSTGPAKGDIYFTDPEEVNIYGPDGKALGKLTQMAGEPWGEVCGVAVDPAGHVYVGLYPSSVNEYTPTSGTVTNADYTTSLTGLNEVCNVAADIEGSVYVDTWTPGRSGPIVKYAAHSGGSKLIVNNGGGALAVANTASAELFVGHHKEIQQYDASGDLLGSFGAGESSEYQAIAVDAESARVYVSNHGKVEIWQGVVIPDVQTGHATSLNAAGSATLNGNVDPEGISVESCSFQYGLSASYGSAASCVQATPFSGTSAVPVSAGVSGLMPNQAYHYRIIVTDTHGTVVGSDQTFTVLVLPTVEDQAPTVSQIARASAKLTGTVNPEQVDAGYHFEYGVTEGYGNSTTIEHTGSAVGDRTVSQELGELLPDTLYHYRLVANNIAGTAFGEDHTFTTGAAATPTVATGASSGVAQNDAIVAGAVDTNGLPTTYGFEIGTSIDYGPPTGLGSVGAGLSEVPVSLSLTGLSPGTTYHYRITASNVDGTAYGADETFVTSEFASTFATPPAPLPFVEVPAIVFPGEPKPVTTKKSTTKSKKKKPRKKAKKKASKNKKKK